LCNELEHQYTINVCGALPRSAPPASNRRVCVASAGEGGFQSRILNLTQAVRLSRLMVLLGPQLEGLPRSGPSHALLRAAKAAIHRTPLNAGRPLRFPGHARRLRSVPSLLKHLRCLERS
jgi:hypothetical protein